MQIHDHQQQREDDSFVLRSLHNNSPLNPYLQLKEMGTYQGTWTVKQVLLITAVLTLNYTKVAGLLILSGSSSEAGQDSNVSDATVRVDPLDNLKEYRGGYNVTNEHYWSSIAFTGIYGYGIAVICLLFGLGYGIFLLVITTCCKRNEELKKRSFSLNLSNLQHLVLVVCFTLLAVTACGLVFGGNSKFHSRAKTVIGVIIHAADEASDTIYLTTGAMKKMSVSLKGVDGSPQATKATDFLISTSDKLETQASTIKTHASKNRHLIYKGLNILYIITTVVISVTLTVIISLLVCGVLKFQKFLQGLIAFCWIFIVLGWLLFGFYFFLQNLAGDTCTALEGFQRDPYNNSLSPILPCEELLSAKPVLLNVSRGIYELVVKVNVNISTSYGNIAQICNPFSPPPMYEYQPWNCSPTSVRIGEIPKYLRMLACPDSMGICNGGILIPASYYKAVDGYCFSIQTLLDAYPGMESLIECATVKYAFSEILQKHCKPLQRYIQMLWMGLVFLSVVLLALVLIWTFGPQCAQTIDQSEHGQDQQVEIIGKQ